MKPISPVVPGMVLPEVTYAKDQPQYIPLPGYRDAEGVILTRWQLSWKERLQALFGGCIWLSVMTFNRPLQPVKLETQCPIKAVAEVVSE